MIRIGYVMDRVVEWGNMQAAFDEVVHGRKRKRSRQGRYLLAHRDEVIRELQASLANGSFELGEYRERDIQEAGKKRRLQILPMLKRIGVNAVMRVVDTYLRRRFIRTTGASVKGRGTHDLMRYICDDIRKDPDGTRYGYKFDLRKCYENMSQEVAKACVRRVFKDPVLLKLMDKFISMLDSGVSLGLRSSQGVVNQVLSVWLDHVLKEQCRAKHYYRYCDDGLVLAATKEELWRIRAVVHEQMAKIGMTVKPNERVFPIGEGIDFLGYVIKDGDYVRMRKRNKVNFARRLHRVKSRKRRRVLIASFWGLAKHARCIHLFKKLTGIVMAKKFSDLGVVYKAPDGKKRFPGEQISIHELINVPILVKDYEVGVKTTHGDDRYVVAIERDGKPFKFFTNSEEMKGILDQVAQLEDGFPFETTIKTEPIGKGRTKCVFT